MNVSPLTLDMMKAIRTTLVLALLLMVTTAQAQRGSWKGELDVQGIKLPLVFHFTDKGCTMDSPAQNVRGIPTQTVVKGDSVTVEIAMIGARFEGVNKGTEIAGTFTQQGIAFPLTLTPGEVTLNRPQTPKPPFDYLTEEVSFTNGSFTLRGTLTKPRGCSRQTPVVLMVSGSGQQNRDEELFGHKPFAVLADALARQGIASLRYDDRGWGDASVRFYEFTTADFYADALSGLALLRKQFDRVGMLGHSEGGTIALMAAAEGKTDFIVTLAAMAVSGKETMIAQNRSVLAAAGTTPEMTEAYCMAIGCALDQLAQGKKTADIKPTGVPVLFRSVFDKALKQGDSPYIRHLLNVDVRGVLGKIACPVLALNGNRDTQVDCVANLGALENGLVNSRHTLKTFDGLNHLFQTCHTGLVVEYQQIEETIAPTVMETITSWIKNL